MALWYQTHMAWPCPSPAHTDPSGSRGQPCTGNRCCPAHPDGLTHCTAVTQNAAVKVADTSWGGYKLKRTGL